MASALLAVGVSRNSPACDAAADVAADVQPTPQPTLLRVHTHIQYSYAATGRQEPNSGAEAPGTVPDQRATGTRPVAVQDVTP